MESGNLESFSIATNKRGISQPLDGVLKLPSGKRNLLARMNMVLLALVLATTICLSYAEPAFGFGRFGGGGGFGGGGFHGFGGGFRGFGGGFHGFGGRFPRFGGGVPCLCPPLSSL